MAMDLPDRSDRIGTVRTHAHSSVQELVRAVLHQRRMLNHLAPEPPAPDAVDEGAEAVAYVNHGRWVADCPSPACTGAELVDPDEPRFYCLSCYNAAFGGLWLPVRFPPERERQAIERALLARPRARNRNWYPGETVAQLEEEHRRYQAAEEERMMRLAGMRRVVERHGPVFVERWVPAGTGRDGEVR
jgi:hypothetical protein